MRNPSTQQLNPGEIQMVTKSMRYSQYGLNKWAAFEIKLNPDAVDKAAKSLLDFKANVDTSRHGEPTCLGVITSTGAGGLRDDAVHVIPIGCLGP